MWKKILVRQHDLLKSFGASTTKLKISQKVFVRLLQLYNSFGTPDIEKKKKCKEINSFLKLCFKMIFSNTKTILN